MNKQPYDNIRFDWLGNEANAGLSISPDQTDYKREEYELPNKFGVGYIETLTLGLGMTIFRAEHTFQKTATGHIIPAGDITVKMSEPTFQAQIIRGGRVLEEQINTKSSLLLSPGIDLFRYSKNYQIIPSLDGSSNSVMTCLSIGQSQLESLIGYDDANELLNSLELLPMPKAIAKEIPLHVSSHLHTSLNNSLLGSARKLNSQARVLNYLSALIQYIKSLNEFNPYLKKSTIQKSSKKRSHTIHEYLMNIEGKVPTLDYIAKQFGCCARTLNDEFISEFGESIYSFITNQRLLAAHELIKVSDIALKEISFRLGYAHVNHFTTAFKNKFGYPPGSLRKKKLQLQN